MRYEKMCLLTKRRRRGRERGREEVKEESKREREKGMRKNVHVHHASSLSLSFSKLTTSSIQCGTSTI